MGKAWTRTPDQTAYLKTQFTAYFDARAQHTIEAFRAELYDGWALRWPERAVLFPSWKESDPPLTKDQMTTLGRAISKRKKQLYDYVRWHSSAKPVRTTNPRSLLSRYVSKVHQANGKGRKKPTRKRTVLEVYNDLYYQSKLRNMVQEALEKDSSYASLPQNERSARQMAVYRKIRADSWAMESDDVKAEVLKIYNHDHQDKANASNDDDNDDDDDDDDNDDNDDDEKTLLQRQQECVDVIGQVITSFLQDANEATGWAFYVLGGGMNKEGKIKVATSSVGKTISGSTFQIAHKNWQEGVVGPWLDFLHLRHPIEERHRRATIWAEDSNAQDGINTSSENCTPIVAPTASVTTVMTPSPLQTVPASSPFVAPAANVTTVMTPSPLQTVPASNPFVAPAVNVTTVMTPSPLQTVPASNPFVAPAANVTTIMTPSPLQTVPASNPSSAPPANATAVSESHQAHDVNMYNSTDLYASSLNVFDSTSSAFAFPMTPQNQVAPLTAMPVQSPMSRLMSATDPLYPWNFKDVDVGVPLSPSLDPYDTSNWTFPATSTFPSTVGPGQATPFAMTNLIAPANGIAALNNLGPTTSLINTVDNSVASHSMLDTAADSTLDEVGNSVKENERGGNRSKKRKTHEEESAHFILPDGSRRPHKPRRIDENNAASTNVGKAVKKGRRK